jgi:hypothetical protein
MGRCSFLRLSQLQPQAVSGLRGQANIRLMIRWLSLLHALLPMLVPPIASQMRVGELICRFGQWCGRGSGRRDFILGQRGKMLKHFRQPRNGKLQRSARLTARTVGYEKLQDDGTMYAVSLIRWYLVYMSRGRDQRDGCQGSFATRSCTGYRRCKLLRSDSARR